MIYNKPRYGRKRVVKIYYSLLFAVRSSHEFIASPKFLREKYVNKYFSTIGADYEDPSLSISRSSNSPIVIKVPIKMDAVSFKELIVNTFHSFSLLQS